MSVTHDMIAAKLGINRTTVTKALKGDTSIRELTRKKVVETATMMGYDFKQSQQNRREGKRFFVKENVRFTFLDFTNDRPISNGEGTLTNLSSTGLLLKITSTDQGTAPVMPELGLRLLVPDSSPLCIVPRARIVRLNYQPTIELAAKFEKEDTMSQDSLMEIERRSFSNLENKH
jgi:hypothetical protein